MVVNVERKFSFVDCGRSAVVPDSVGLGESTSVPSGTISWSELSTGACGSVCYCILCRLVDVLKWRSWRSRSMVRGKR